MKREVVLLMSPRLLSLLSQIEYSLKMQEVAAASEPTHRSVNYHKGLARLGFASGGSISLQSFTLADGQVCVKASMTWPGCDGVAVHSVYPHGEKHDWETAADNLASAWAAGPSSALVMTSAVNQSDSTSTERLAAAG